MKTEALHEVRQLGRWHKKLLAAAAALLLSAGASYAQTYLSETFEGSFTGNPAAPSGWTQSRISPYFFGLNDDPEADGTFGDKDWGQNTISGGIWARCVTTPNPTASTAVPGRQHPDSSTGDKALFIEDGMFGNSPTISGNLVSVLGVRRMESPVLSPTIASSTSPYVKFWMFSLNNNIPFRQFTNLRIVAQNASVNDGRWSTIHTIMHGYKVATNPQWEEIAFLLPTQYRVAGTKLGIEVSNSRRNNTGSATSNFWIDNFRVEEFTPGTVTISANDRWSLTNIKSTDNVVVASGANLLVDGLLPRCQNLTINAGGRVTCSNITFQVFGNVLVNGRMRFNGNFYVGGNFTVNDSLIHDNQAGASIWWAGGQQQFFSMASTAFFRQDIVVTNRPCPFANARHLNPAGVDYDNDIPSGTYANTIRLGNNLALYDGDVTVSATTFVSGWTGRVTSANVGNGRLMTNPSAYQDNGTRQSWLIIDELVNPEAREHTLGYEVINLTGGLVIASLNNYVYGQNLLTKTPGLALGRGILTGTYSKPIKLSNAFVNTSQINNFPAGPNQAGVNTAASPAVSNHGSYLNGVVEVDMPTTGSAGRSIPYGIGNSLSNVTGANAPVNKNRLKWWGISPGGTWNASATTLRIKALEIDSSPGSRTYGTGIQSLMGNYIYKVQALTGGLPATARFRFFYNNSGAAPDEISGNQDELLIAYATDLNGPWSVISNSSGTSDPVADTGSRQTNDLNWTSTGTYYFAFANNVVAAQKSVGTIAFNAGSSAYLARGTNNNPIFRIDIPVIDNLGSLILNEIKVNGLNVSGNVKANGVKLYRTSTTTFSTGTQLGTAQSFSSGVATFSGLNYDLPGSTTNYIWVSVDLENAATTTNTGVEVSAFVAAGDIDIASTFYPNSTSSTIGRKLMPNYCVSTIAANTYHTSTCGSSFINGFSVGTLNNSTTGCASTTANSYTRFDDGAYTATLERLVDYTATVSNNAAAAQHFAIWLDLNNNDVFEAGEFYNIGLVAESGTGTINISVPADATLGLVGLRVRSRSTAFTSGDACGNYTGGETEDYFVTIAPAPPCNGTTAGGTISGEDTVYNGEAIILSVAGTSGSIQWTKSSSISGPFQPISGANSASFSATATISGLGSGFTEYYRISATSPGCVTSFSPVFTLRIQEQPGDNFFNAIDLGNNTYSYSNTTNLATGYRDFYSPTSTPGDANGLATRTDVFYKFTSPVNDTLKISTCASSLAATRLHILNNAGARIDGNAGSGVLCANTRASLRYPISAGQQIYIVVEGATADGLVTLDLEFANPVFVSGPTVSNWNDASSWSSNSVPTSTSVVSIPTGKTIVVSGSGNQIGTLTLQPGAKLIFSGTGSLEVFGNLTNAGSIVADTNQVLIFGGSGTQSVSGSGTYNLHTVQVNNTSTNGVRISSGVSFNVRNLLELGNSAKFFNNLGGSVRLKSTAQLTGALMMGGGATYTGNITPERFIPQNLRIVTGSYFFTGANVTARTLTDYQAQTPLSGFAGSSNPAGNPSVWFYDNSVNNSNFGWTNPTSTANAMAPGKGAQIFFRAHPVMITNGGVFGLTGTPVTGTVNFPVTFCSGGTCAGGADNGYNFVANPYPSTIDWDAASGWTKTNISSSIYVYSFRGGWKAYNGMISNPPVSESGINGMIQSGQGFFVEATGAAPALSSTEAVKVANGPTTGNNVARRAQVERLAIQLAGGNVNEWTTLVYNNNPMPMLDAKDMGSTFASIGAGNKRMAINNVVKPTSQSVTKLALSGLASGTYSLRFAEMFLNSADAYIADKFLGTINPITAGMEYSFTVTANPASAGNDRFEVIYAAAKSAGVSFKHNPLSVYPNPNQGSFTVELNNFEGAAKITVYNNLGSVVATEDLGSVSGQAQRQLNLGNLAKGIYFVELTSAGSSFRTRMVIE